MIKIQVLGTGCPKCTMLFDAILKIVRDNNIQAEVTKVDDIQEILNFGVMMTPAFAIDGVIKVVGKIPKPDELAKIILSI